ncbi:MAG: M20/M25/M40 family metallo-hydrolase [Promethearchaeota archaeon]|nr:MAG: M20/M25/M40 family metallo-hydrolase [Candidatus Lokiarchaeota archaeon]
MIDGNRIKENLEEFVFPRLSGTENEKKAFKIAKKKIEKLQLSPLVQEFSFTTFYPRVYQKLVFTLGFWLLFVLYLNFGYLFFFINLAIILLIYIPIYFITRNPENIKIGKKRRSQNLYVSLEEENKNKNILFLCHLDSKGQRLPIKYRGLFFKLWVYSLIFGLIIIIFKNILFTQYSFWLYIIGIVPIGINLISTVMIDLNITNNKSPGATDNASGIVTVLELLNHYSNPKFRLKNYNLWFIFTGAEETGTMGIRNFYKIIEHLEREKSIMFNFDTIGRGLDVWTSTERAIHFKNAENLNAFIHTKKKFIRTGRSDAYYLKKKNFRGFGFGDQSSYKYVHTINDTIDKVDTFLLEKLCKHIIDVINRIDNNTNR